VTDWMNTEDQRKTLGDDSFMSMLADPAVLR